MMSIVFSGVAIACLLGVIITAAVGMAKSTVDPSVNYETRVKTLERCFTTTLIIAAIGAVAAILAMCLLVYIRYKKA